MHEAKERKFSADWPGAMAALTNLIPPDIFVPGNHEFDFGKQVFLTRMAEARFPLYAAIATGFVVFVNLLLRPIVSFINRTNNAPYLIIGKKGFSSISQLRSPSRSTSVCTRDGSGRPSPSRWSSTSPCHKLKIPSRRSRSSPRRIKCARTRTRLAATSLFVS